MAVGNNAEIARVDDPNATIKGAQAFEGIGLQLLLERKTIEPGIQVQRVADKQEMQDKMDHCTVTGRVFSWTHTYDVACQSGNNGTLTENLFSWGRSYHYEDKNGVTIAKGRQEVFAWGSTVDVTDGNSKALGKIKENVFQSAFKPYTNYTIYDPAGQSIGTSKKIEWLNTDFSIADANGHTVAHMHRPWINWLRDQWSVDVDRNSKIDPRLLMMIPAYKSSVDADRK